MPLNLWRMLLLVLIPTMSLSLSMQASSGIDELRTTIKNCSKTEIGGECRVSEKNSCLSWEQCGNGYRDGSCYCASINNNGGYYSKLGDDDKVRLWSSSTLSDGTDVAWYVSFNYGLVNGYSKSDNLYVRCVR